MVSLAPWRESLAQVYSNPVADEDEVEERLNHLGFLVPSDLLDRLEDPVTLTTTQK